MAKNENDQDPLEGVQSPEAVRLLWEGTQKALEEWGIDRRDLASLCAIVTRLAEHRLMVIEVSGSPPGSEKVAEQLRRYRDSAAALLRSAAESPPEPAWGEVAEKLRSAGASPLDYPTVPRE